MNEYLVGFDQADLELIFDCLVHDLGNSGFCELYGIDVDERNKHIESLIKYIEINIYYHKDPD